MRFKIMIKTCLRCDREIPVIEQSYSRKYCKDCAKLSVKEAQRRHLIKTGKIHEKPCFTCGKLTFRRRTCSSECGKKAVSIDKLEASIKRRLILIEKQKTRILELRDPSHFLYPIQKET